MMGDKLVRIRNGKVLFPQKRELCVYNIIMPQNDALFPKIRLIYFPVFREPYCWREKAVYKFEWLINIFKKTFFKIIMENTAQLSMMILLDWIS